MNSNESTNENERENVRENESKRKKKWIRGILFLSLNDKKSTTIYK
jgi:hypothetical protein